MNDSCIRTQLLNQFCQEENRLRAKAIREQELAAARKSSNGSGLHLTPNGFIAGQKRPHSTTVSTVSSTQRDGRVNGVISPPRAGSGSSGIAADAAIRPAKKFEKNAYIEYDFSRMTDTKGGFLSAEDDPHNRAMHARQRPDEEQRPAHMTEREWERHQLLKKLRASKSGPFEPAVSALDAAFKESEGRAAEIRRCAECASLDIDWTWEEVFGVRVCARCKEKFPEKYSLLTKTEVREDYLLTERKLFLSLFDDLCHSTNFL